ncbi:DUF3088 family protein [Hymenobacter terrenus]|uniref:DUF3088 family protein n=1 Tax=Hymenobacter terrenus TaxID=1629124 RepID=UPI0006197557|nr:DUF3088 family protein [Hymenobacter terrenus]
MTKLFLLKPDFLDEKIGPGGRPYYCPHCAMIEGVLSYYPSLRQVLAITHLDFPRPRRELVDLVGEENQGCPALIIQKEENADIDTSYFTAYGDFLLVNSALFIARYLADKHQVGAPHP